MQICKVQLETGSIRVGVLEDDHVQLLETELISEILHVEKPTIAVQMLRDENAPRASLRDVTFMPPLDRQEVWAAGVTYLRSRQARERESEGAAQFYDKVYTADRPEIFFKAPAERVVPTGGRVRIRADSKWNVPEPEVALHIAPDLRIVGYTIGNDMSSRDIEGENPLYLPQAKMYDGACALGPVVTLPEAMPSGEQATIQLTIERQGAVAFEGSTTLARMARSFEDLVSWLGREMSFPNGAVLMTGTGIIPEDNFTLAVGDRIVIEVNGIGRLINVVDQ